jgi:hypothetical protein
MASSYKRKAKLSTVPKRKQIEDMKPEDMRELLVKLREASLLARMLAREYPRQNYLSYESVAHVLDQQQGVIRLHQVTLSKKEDK